MADLVVELYGTRAGVLSGTWRTFDFVPDPAAAARFGIDSTVLSVAIPLTVAPVRSRKERRQNFFRELLPEGRMLARLAQQARLPEQDVIGMLREYGRDVAGVIQLANAELPDERAYPGLARDISRFASNLLTGHAIGPAAITADLSGDLTFRRAGASSEHEYQADV